MSDEENYIEIEDDEEGGDNNVHYYNLNIILSYFLFIQEGMDIDINKAMKDCEGIEKVQERTNTGAVS